MTVLEKVEESESPSELPISPIIVEACSHKKQELTIFPTEQCNFRCTYCYEDFELGKMSVEVQDGIINFIKRRAPELDYLMLKWFGGEPLAAADVMKRICREAKVICDENGVKLSGGTTTNAWLLNLDLFEELVACDQRFYQITLDGVDADHDQYRKKANGAGTFKKIWQNLQAIHTSNSEFTIQLRVHVRRDEETNARLLLDRIASEFGSDRRFTIDLEHVRNLGGEGGKTVDRPYSLAEFRPVAAELNAYFVKKCRQYHGRDSVFGDFPPADEPSAERPIDKEAVPAPTAQYVCYATKPNSLLVRSDGALAKCTVALKDNRNAIGRINPDGTIKTESAKLKAWARGLVSLDPGELSCPLVNLPAVG